MTGEIENRLDRIEEKYVDIARDIKEIKVGIVELKEKGCIVGNIRYTNLSDKVVSNERSIKDVLEKQGGMKLTIAYWSGGVAMLLALLGLVLAILKVIKW